MASTRINANLAKRRKVTAPTALPAITSADRLEFGDNAGCDAALRRISPDFYKALSAWKVERQANPHAAGIVVQVRPSPQPVNGPATMTATVQ